ncbi:thioesterase superfamily protein [Ceratobasidium sp. AG-Ba]|nr:thioesterase superfamily protein [Ceratobasidium sp. AG-Ba]
MASGISVNDIKGNAPDDQKQMCIDVLDFYAELKDHFAYSVGKRLRIEEVSEGDVVNGKSRSLVVCTIDVKEGNIDMLNLLGTMHGGCAAYLIDLCTSIAIAVRPKGAKPSEDWWGKVAVSQALSVVYHSPARVGSTLRIISETIVAGGRTGTIRCEIWDSTKNVLVATGTHTKMPLRNMAIGKL